MLRRQFLGALAALLVIVVVAPAAFAAKLVALTIGVSAYEGKAYLSSPVKDAVLVADTLAGFGFQVRVVKDPDLATLAREIDSFVEAARGADIAIVYYSGHGKQVNGEAYFAPLNQPRDEAFAEATAVHALVERLDRAGVAFKFVIVDACRNNPTLADDGSPSRRSSENVGAAERRKLGNNALLTFASAPGQYSQDWGGTIGYSLYTKMFVDTLRKYERIEVQRLTQETRAQVLRATRQPGRDIQEPWENSSMLSPVYLERSQGGHADTAGTSVIHRENSGAPKSLAVADAPF
jgi:uncharacterized caspase-like protein